MASPKTLATRTFNSAAYFIPADKWKPFTYRLANDGGRHPASYRGVRRLIDLARRKVAKRSRKAQKEAA